MSSGIGLVLGLLLTLMALPIRNFFVPPLPRIMALPLLAWGIFLFFLALALLEIPLMVYGLRKVSQGKSGNAPTMTLVGNTIYVAFPAVYALPNLLLSGQAFLWMGLLISATALLRFASSLLFLSPVADEKTEAEKDNL